MANPENLLSGTPDQNPDGSTDDELNSEGRNLWNRKAEYWDELIGDRGNRFHRVLVSPSVERLLNVEPGEKILFRKLYGVQGIG